MGDKGEFILSELKSDILTNFSHRNGQLGLFLEVSESYQLFGKKKTTSLSDFISQINSALGIRKHRPDALCLLRAVIDQCTTDTLAQHWDYWLKTLIHILQSEDDVTVLQLTCGVLDPFLFHLKTSEFGHQFATTMLSGVLTDLMQKIKEKNASHYHILVRLFVMFATHFPGPCGPFGPRIEQFLLPLFDSTNTQLQQAAAKCFAALPQCGGAGSLGIKHTEFWSIAATKLLSGLHDVLDVLYGPLETGSNIKNRPPAKLLQLPDVDTQEPAHTMALATRFTGLCQALEFLLRQKFPAVVRLPILSILEMIDRTISITPRYLMAKATSQRIRLSAIVPTLHQRALGILCALATSARSELVPFSESVVGWLVQMLNWTNVSSTESGQQKPLMLTRCSVYETLVMWLHCLGCSSSLESVATDIIQHVIIDCSPPADSLMMKSSSAKLGQVEVAFVAASSRRKKRQKNFYGGGFGSGSDLVSVTTHRKCNPTAGVNLCIASLEALRCLLIYCGRYLSSSQHRSIHDLCRLPVALFNRRSSADIAQPYNSPVCRRAIYRLLLASMMSSLPQRPSPDQVIVKIFSLGLNDSDLEVRSFCAEALCTVENIIHPRLPIVGAPGLFNCAAAARDEWNTAAEPSRMSFTATDIPFCDTEPSHSGGLLANGSVILASVVASDALDSTSDVPLKYKNDSYSSEQQYTSASIVEPDQPDEDDEEEDEVEDKCDDTPLDAEDANELSEVQNMETNGGGNSCIATTTRNVVGISGSSTSDVLPSVTTVSCGEDPEVVPLTSLSSHSFPVLAEVENGDAGIVVTSMEQLRSMKRKHGSDSESSGDNSDSDPVEIEASVLDLMVQSFSYKEPPTQ